MDLIARVRQATDFDPALNEEVALALGWQRRMRTGLGLNGRTPGRNGWVSPNPPWDWRPRLPKLVGRRNLSRTVAALLASPGAPTPKDEPR